MSTYFYFLFGGRGLFDPNTIFVRAKNQNLKNYSIHCNCCYNKIIMPERELYKSWQRTGSYKLSQTGAAPLGKVLYQDLLRYAGMEGCANV